MSVLNKDSQKFEVKEVSENEQNICYLGTNNGKVTIRGIGINDSINSSRYDGVYALLSLMESRLEKTIDYDISLSFIGLEALVKVFLEGESDEKAINFFTRNISPRNFFYMVNDIDRQKLYFGSDRIYSRFLSTEEELRALNNFYNEFEDLVNESFKHNLTNIYAFDTMEKRQNKKDSIYLNEIGTALNSNVKKEKNMAFNILNEYYTDRARPYISDRSLDDLNDKVQKINNNWSKILNNTKTNEYYNIDFLYELAIAK